MLGQVARFADRYALKGQLVGASRRLPVASGDLQAVDTRNGTYVLVRSQSGGGPSDVTPAGACGATSSRDTEYTVVPPRIVAFWSALVRHGWAWPTKGADGTFTFTSDGSGEPVATARCDDLGCDLHIGNEPFDAATLDTSRAVGALFAAAPPEREP
jgi:hypothetical protein